MIAFIKLEQLVVNLKGQHMKSSLHFLLAGSFRHINWSLLILAKWTHRHLEPNSTIAPAIIFGNKSLGLYSYRHPLAKELSIYH